MCLRVKKSVAKICHLSREINIRKSQNTTIAAQMCKKKQVAFWNLYGNMCRSQ